MKFWMFDRSGSPGLIPVEPTVQAVPAHVSPARSSSDVALDMQPGTLIPDPGNPVELDKMERGEQIGTVVGRISDASNPTDPAEATVRRGIGRMVNAAAAVVENAVSDFIEDSESDTEIPKIPVADRYEGVKDRQASFMAAAEARVKAGSDLSPSPFATYRHRMGERGHSGPFDAGDPRNAGTDTGNRVASLAPNRQIPPPVHVSHIDPSRRLLRSDRPLRVAPATTAASMGARAGSGNVRGSLEISDVADRPRATSLARPTEAATINEGRAASMSTQVKNLRIVQTRYMLPREITIAFGIISLMGLVIGCTVLAVSIRNASYLRGPKSASLIPGLKEQLDELTTLVKSMADGNSG